MSAEAQAFWDDVHRRRAAGRRGRPHPQLVEAMTGATPESALDLGCGDGANAIWLAARGWTVTAVDVSPAALDRAARHAEQAGVAARVRWQRADLADWGTSATFDLVTAFFLHTPLDLGLPAAVLARGAARLRAGGALLVVGHSTKPPWASRPGETTNLPSAGELVATLGLAAPSWRVRQAAEVPRAVTGHDGTAATVLDTVVHAVRADAPDHG